MHIKKLASTLLVCALVFALLLTGCNTPADDTDTTTTTTGTTTTATDGDVTTTTVEGDTTTVEGDTTTVEGDTTTVEGDTTTVGGDTTTKKTTTTQKSTLSKVYTEPLLPSFIRNDDGTCTDRKTGVTFIDDDCDYVVEYDGATRRDNGTKLYDSDLMIVDGNMKDFFGNDGGRYCRTVYSDCKGAWFSYKLSEGITEIAINVATMNDATGVYKGFKVLVSKNGKNGWTEVPLKWDNKQDSVLGSGWILRYYKMTGIDKSNKYIKIQMLDDFDGVLPCYVPNFLRVRVNNIDKMNDADRNLEGRVSKTFYVDSKNGNDKNDGTSEKTAWKSIDRVNQGFYQPGDKILFKAGESFVGTLNVKGYGTASDRLVIGTYGGNARAKLSARGEVQRVANVSAVYATVENLDISGKDAQAGLAIGAGQAGANKGIIVQNCYVHDLNTDDKYFAYANAGIVLNATGLEPTWFDGVVVRNNLINNVSRVGIYLTGAWGDRPGAAWGASGSLYKSDSDGWWPNKNCVISGNSVTNVHGDGILVISCKDTIVEKNYGNNNFTIGDDKSKLNYLNTNGFSVACATFWCVNTNGTVFQENEVGYTHLDAGYVDGEAFDIDGVNKDCIVQYNYTHNNVGGFLLMCDWQPDITEKSKHIVRFNLTVDDGWSAFHGSISTTTTYAAADIYNNTFVQRTADFPMASIFSDGKNFTWRNNIFYGAGAGRVDNGTLDGFVMDNNVFCGGATVPSRNGLSVKNSKTEDPKFKNANFTHAKNDPAKIADAIAAFTPTKKIAGATNIKDNGGRDIKGNKFTNLDFYGCVKH